MMYETYAPDDPEEVEKFDCQRCECKGKLLIMTEAEFLLTGEPIEDYKEEFETCPDCQGEGRIEEHHID